MTNLSIVITDFNGYHQTRRCLEALKQSEFQDFEIILVDHGTTSETKDRISAEHPGVILIHGDEKLWWAGATNLGITFALEKGADLIMLLNYDCYVSPSTIRTLFDHSRKIGKAIIAPVQRDWKSKQIAWINPSTLFLLGFPTLIGARELTPTMTAADKISVGMIIGGRGAIIPKAVFDSIGMLDDQNLPHYGADHDLFLRARRNNIPLYVSTKSIVDVDNTRTTVAGDYGSLTLAQFRDSLHNRRSHRNVRDMTSLFRKHYPIPHLYWLGVFLYYSRYSLSFMARRIYQLLIPKFWR